MLFVDTGVVSPYVLMRVRADAPSIVRLGRLSFYKLTLGVYVLYNYKVTEVKSNDSCVNKSI